MAVYQTSAPDGMERVSVGGKRPTAPVAGAGSSHQRQAVGMVDGNPASARYTLAAVGPGLGRHRLPPCFGVRRRGSGQSCAWRR